ncbi:MAG: Uma2 family endonuclease [Halieaceae bacterium]|nr:Uma2 family endonuclease [Halieaceae bacterium]
MEVTLLAPTVASRHQPASYDDYLAIAGEDVLVEWANGEIVIHMPPKTKHQQVVSFLLSLLRFYVDYFNLGVVLVAPFEMKLAHSSREPDLIFVAQEHEERLTAERLQGAADLVVEVVSADSARRDRVAKFNEYLEAEVREYWVIDPREGKEQADFWVLDEQGRYQAGGVDEAGVYRSTALAGFWLQVDWLWQEPLPDSQQTFADIAGFPEEIKAALRSIAAQGPKV